MSNVADDERSLLEAIRASLGSYFIKPWICWRYMYPYTSYVLKNVTAFRLGGRKMVMASDSSERVAASAVAEFDFKEDEFRDISDILKEIEKASSGEMDEHQFALSLPRVLYDMDYSLYFILVGPLASFALSHGVWLLVLRFVCADSSEEDIMMVLKRVEGLFITLKRNQGMGESDYHLDFHVYISLLSSSVTRMPRDKWESFGSLYNLINTMCDVILVVHQLSQDVFLFRQDVYEYVPEKLMAEFDDLALLSTYWVRRGVFACSSQCNNLPKNGYVIQDSHNLTYINDNLVSIYERLRNLVKNVKQYMDDQSVSQRYQIPNNYGLGNYSALMALFDLHDSKDLVLPHCSRKNMELSAKTLRRMTKTLVLIISALDVSSDVIYYLKGIYSQFMASQQANCEFVWLPICGDSWTTSLEEQYTNLLHMMPWYTVKYPNFITKDCREFIRDGWMFHRKPIAVVLDDEGKVVCPNAMHLMYIWGIKAYPFTRARERDLWKNESRLYSLILGFDPNISSMLEASEWVIIYGGTDVEWIAQFLASIRGISVDLVTPINMIYVGRSIKSDKLHEIISTSQVDKSRNFILDSKKIWYFWTRLESLLISRCQANNASDHTSDPFIRYAQELLCYASAESWASLIIPSSTVMVHGPGHLMLQAFMEYDLWKIHLQAEDFIMILYNHIEKLRQSHASSDSCSRIVLNIDNKDVVGSLRCPHCIRFKEKRIQHKCCHGDDELQQ